jgi:hypothetical protein
MANTEQESQGDRIDRNLRELCARRGAFVAEARRAIAAGEDIGIMQLDELRLTICVGTRTALIADGICTPDQFPDGDKRIKWNTDVDPTKEYWKTTKLARGHFIYLAGVTEDEFRCRYDKQSAAEREARARGPEGEYGSVEAYTERAELLALGFKHRLLDILSGAAERSEFGSVTLAYDRDTIQRVESLCEQIEQTVQSGSASWTQGERAAQRNAEAARADPRFARFLHQACGERAR